MGEIRYTMPGNIKDALNQVHDELFKNEFDNQKDKKDRENE